MEKSTGYIYDGNNYVVEVVHGTNAQIEAHWNDRYSSTGEYNLTYSPAFGFSSGLVMTDDTTETDLG